MKSDLLPHWERLWTKEYVLDRIAEFDRRGYPLHACWIANNEAILIAAASKYFESWNDALTAAGLDYFAIKRGLGIGVWKYPDKKSMLREIRRRAREGMDLNFAAMQRGNKPDRGLERGAIMRFGSWDSALVAAGLNPKRIRDRASSRKEKVTSV